MLLLLLVLITLLIAKTSALPQGILDIRCLQVGSTATALWTNKAGETCTWTGVVGSNFGINPRNNAIYDCNGRCGAGCDGTVPGTLVASLTPFAQAQDIYTQDCFSHDICSWFYGAKGGPRDPNCGHAFIAASDDTSIGYSCGAQNPSYDVNPPSDDPICVASEALVDINIDTAIGKT